MTSIDFRSDTVTQPTVEMREAIANAAVGDDVIDVDPTVDALEKATAELLGKERAIFMPSGSMTNQVALRIHCKPGDEFICEEGCHIYNYEQAAYAQLSGIAVRPLRGEAGVLTCDHLLRAIRPDDEHMARTRLLTVENTHNRAGGRIQPYDTVREVTAWAHEHGLRTHLDGARIMNAVTASGVDASTWAQHFDTVSICFSKGLGAPVGSALAGSDADIREARRHRKAFGGGMRQAGIIAAGALFALKNNVAGLAEDHTKAQMLAAAIRETPSLRLINSEVETNIVIFSVTSDSENSAVDIVRELARNDVRMLALDSQTVRAVTHLGVSLEETHRACDVIKAVGH